mmetsp:Transcript_7748/g.11769  ORF Transcript_7748/g.11769 Transcript_7748/m.11769 type:complete len:291 (+) Transcript_7748:120-992(+)
MMKKTPQEPETNGEYMILEGNESHYGANDVGLSFREVEEAGTLTGREKGNPSSTLLDEREADDPNFNPTTSTSLELKDHSGAAAGLFNNMRTPAALILGATIPLGLLMAPDLEEGDSPAMILLKKTLLLLAMSSLLSEILAITYATVAINKLSELQYHRTMTVADLIENHFELAWIGTNIHFLLGLFTFGLLVGFRAYFKYGEPAGKIIGSLSVAAILQATSFVNEGIAMGHGDIDNTEFQFANNLFMLTMRYIRLLLCRVKKGPLPIISIGLYLYSTILTVLLIVDTYR